jgi:hypothetical protein
MTAALFDQTEHFQIAEHRHHLIVIPARETPKVRDTAPPVDQEQHHPFPAIQRERVRKI